MNFFLLLQVPIERERERERERVMISFVIEYIIFVGIKNAIKMI